MERILILCTGNSARSQMAEGLAANLFGDKVHVDSAGTCPSTVRPEAIAVMAEIGIDISANRSKSVDEFAGQKIDYVLTVCDNAKANCPYFPAERRSIHRAFDDPAEVTGTEEAGQKIDYVLTVCDNAKANCPYFPAERRSIHRAFDDPAEVTGTEEERLAAFRNVRDDIKSFLDGDFRHMVA